ncbi:MAG: LpqB family beta-propeller domain-containing protein [Actinomycetota bacterium]|nr:LpqB family beta-propeller domain-containing protein [Actinomycetota bacterium]
MSSERRATAAGTCPPRACGLRRGLLLLALALVPACMQVPDSGPVHAGPEVGSDDEPVLRFVPSGPRPGQDPVTIINGYLDAMRAYPPNPATVRQFLTRRAAAEWTPGAGTQIYTARPEIERVGADVVRIETRLRARLTDRGSWTAPAPGERKLRREFHLRRVHGQWRITDPARGLLLPEYDIERSYRAYALYFFDPALRVLVPSLVYLPQGEQTATLLLRGLVRGPTEWLRGAVESMVPPTDRADLSVPVTDNGVAQVQLGAAARGLGATERELLAAQLAWTLRQVPDVDAVRVTVNGAPLVLEDGSNLVDVDDTGADFDPADPAATQTLFALRGNQVVAVDQVKGLGSRVAGRFGTGAVPVRTFAVERTGQTVAAVTRGGSTVEVAPIGVGESQVWFDRGSALFDLQWDIHGLLWAVGRTRSGPVVHVLREGRTARVPLRGAPPRDISAFALSRDGLRVAVVEGRGAASRLLLGRVIRPADESMTLAVDSWREVGGAAAALRGFVDVAWESPTELTVVAERRGGSPQVFTVAVDGSVVEPAALLELDIASVADAPDVDRPTVVATRPGTLYLQLADRWSELALQGAYRRPSYVE